MFIRQFANGRIRHGLAILAAGWALLFAFDEQLGVANQAMLLVLLSALSAVWLPPLLSLLASAFGVIAFNVAFIPPRGTLHVDLREHIALLLTTLSVSVIIAVLMGRMRQHASDATMHARRADEQRDLAELLRAPDDVAALCAVFIDNAGAACTSSAGVLLLGVPDKGGELVVGTMSKTELSGLGICARNSQPMGRGTGRFEEVDAWYLPIKGSRATLGAVLLRATSAGLVGQAQQLQHAMALCNLLGAALERASARQHAQDARAAAQGQALRSTLLASIAHDHRTPLATIMGAASALRGQWDRLPPAQRDAYLDTVMGETEQLARLTENTLQLARLDTAQVDLHRDWEAIEELVGTVVRRVRQRAPGTDIHTDVAPGLPLLSCDAILLVQLLDNLIDNALKYAGPAPAILVQAGMGEGVVLLSVLDRGPGIPLALREQVLKPFQRGVQSIRGAGLGLAVCEAIATVHGGRLGVQERAGGGCVVQLSLPVAP
ncbi:MAG: ATP-binding protein [Pseudomonadota bacterium]